MSSERRALAWISWNADLPWEVVEAAARVVGTTTTPREYDATGRFFVGPGEDFSAASGVASSAPISPADAATGEVGHYSGHVERQGAGIEQMPKLCDIREVLSWARARAEVIFIRPSWDEGRHYWGGPSPSPRPDTPDLVIPDDAPGTSIATLSGDELVTRMREFVEGQEDG